MIDLESMVDLIKNVICLPRRISQISTQFLIEKTPIFVPKCDCFKKMSLSRKTVKTGKNEVTLTLKSMILKLNYNK